MNDVERTISRVNRGIKAMQFIADHVHLFTDGFTYDVYSGCVSSFVYASYDDDGNVIEGSEKTKLATAIREIRRAIPGSTVKKEYDDYAFITTINGDDLRFVFRTNRSKVCEKVIVGTEMVEEIDYEKAPKKLVEKEIVEWKCDSILESI